MTSPSGEDVNIEDDHINIDELGDYTIRFKASTPEYKTDSGNDSYCTKEITLTSNVECYIETNPNYDRNKLKVYYLNGEDMEMFSSSGYGRYVKFENNHMGTYIVLIEGVSSSINLPLMISLIIGCAVIIAHHHHTYHLPCQKKKA